MKPRTFLIISLSLPLVLPLLALLIAWLTNPLLGLVLGGFLALAAVWGWLHLERLAHPPATSVEVCADCGAALFKRAGGATHFQYSPASPTQADVCRTRGHHNWIPTSTE